MKEPRFPYQPSRRSGGAEPPQIPLTRPRHSDDDAVDRFAAAMKAKLAKKREEGRGGWEDKEECSAEFLSTLLWGHVSKGDPVDVANLAMMLHQRGEHIHYVHSVFSNVLSRVKQLEEALRPFARIADMLDMSGDVAPGEAIGVNVDRCRDARRALLNGGSNERD